MSQGSHLPPSVQRLPKALRDVWAVSYAEQSHKGVDIAKSFAWRSVRMTYKTRKRFSGGDMSGVLKSLDLSALQDGIVNKFIEEFGDAEDVWPVRIFDDHLITSVYKSFFGGAEFYKVPFSYTKKSIEGDPNGQEILDVVSFASRDTWARVIPTFVEVKVIKQADGTRRWVSVSSGGFEDKDKQIVSTEFLNYAVKAADEDKFYGTLNIFHMEGTDCGDCDFMAVTDSGFLVESGTFHESELGQLAGDYLEEKAEKTGISIEFVYKNLTEDGIYLPPGRIFRRSILPRQLAAFPWSAVSLESLGEAEKGWKIMDDAKKAMLVEIFKGDEEKANAFLNGLDETGAAAKEANVRFKEFFVEPEAAVEPTVPEVVENNLGTVETVTKEEGSTTVEEPVHATDFEPLVSDPISKEFTFEITSEVIEAIAARVTDTLSASFSSVSGQLKALQEGLAGMQTEIETLKQTDGEKVLAKIEDLPRGTIRAILGPVSRPTRQALPAEPEASTSAENLAKIAEETAKTLFSKMPK